jgi:hypothetical protein
MNIPDSLVCIVKPRFQLELCICRNNRTTQLCVEVSAAFRFQLNQVLLLVSVELDM